MRQSQLGQAVQHSVHGNAVDIVESLDAGLHLAVGQGAPGVEQRRKNHDSAAGDTTAGSAQQVFGCGLILGD